jgi:hypothetical protein
MRSEVPNAGIHLQNVLRQWVAGVRDIRPSSVMKTLLSVYLFAGWPFAVLLGWILYNEKTRNTWIIVLPIIFLLGLPLVVYRRMRRERGQVDPK